MTYLLLTFLIVADMLLYGFGAAIQGINKNTLEKKCGEGDRKSARLNQFIEEPAGFVNALQFLATMIGYIIGAFHIRFFAEKIRQGIGGDYPALSAVSYALAMTVMLYLFLTVGVQMPKRIAGKYPEKWAYFLVNPMWHVTRLLFPLTFLISVSSKFAAGLFGVDLSEHPEDVTEEEIISMVNEGHEQGVLEASEAEMITNIFEFGDKEARDIMTHRENIVGIDGEQTLEEVMKFIIDGKNSRYPVYEESIDNIIGILHFKDAVKYNIYQKNRTKPIREIEGLVMEARFIPETRNINNLFQNMQQNKIHMVIVVDEYGQTAGLVAMEDILEEIVGNILDEYDDEENHIRHQGDNTYVMDGLTSLEEVEGLLGISFAGEESETLNGFLINRLERIPEEGDDFETEYEGYCFKILAVENRIVKTVRCQPTAKAAEEPEEIERKEKRS